MNSLEKNALRYIRYIVLIINTVVAAGIYMYYGPQQISSSLKAYALLAFALLYLSLLIGPFYDAFRYAPGRALLTKARRAIGVSTFLFASLHAGLAFFGQLGGFAGLGFLPDDYVLPVVLGFIALVILLLMALTSFDYWTKKLGKNWKRLHRLIYAAGWLVLFHAFSLGSHFTAPDGIVARFVILLVGFLLVLQALRLDSYVLRKRHATANYGSLFVILTSTIVAIVYSLLVPGSDGSTGLSIHAQHLQLARENSQTTATLPGVTGDKAKRYTVQFTHEDNGQDSMARFVVTDAGNGNPVTVFTNVYEKPAHLVVISEDLSYFQHLHPAINGNTLSAPVHFPADGKYRLYLDFQPAGAIEQQFGFIQTIGSVTSVSSPVAPVVSFDTVKTFGQYEVELSKPTKLSASQLTIGNQKLTFTIRDATTKQPVTNLQPYLASFGHLVMVREDSYDYVHVHPADLTIPASTSTSGPTVEFLPLGINGPVKSGVYKVFAQFNPGGQLFTADFWVKVEE